MNGDRIPNDRHVVRLCTGGGIDENGHIMDIAFALRSKDTYLSVFCEEMLGKPNRAEAIAELRVRLSKVLTLRKTGRLAFLEVSKVRAAGTRVGKELRVLHEPDDELGNLIDETHCGIHGYTADDLVVAAALRDAVEDLAPAAQ